MNSPTSHKFVTLDAMRGIAAISVLLYHFRTFFSLTYVFPGGYLAVDLFFVLSGFVIGHAYDRKLAGGMTSAGFIQIRLIRFLPLLWLGIGIGAALLMYRLTQGATGYTKRDVLLATIHNALLLPTNFGKDNLLFPTNWPEWSLFVELVANIVYVFAFRHLTLRVLALISAVAACSVVVVVLKIHSMNAGPFIFDIYAGLIRVFFSFFVGLLIYRTRDWWASRIPQFPPVVLLATLAILLLVPIGGDLRTGYDIAFVVLFSPLLVMCGAVVQPSTRMAPVAIWLGVISYPIYAVHDPVFGWAEVLISSLTPHSGVLAAVIVATIVASAWPLERLYHRRVGGWLSHLAGARASDPGIVRAQQVSVRA